MGNKSPQRKRNRIGNVLKSRFSDWLHCSHNEGLNTLVKVQNVHCEDGGRQKVVFCLLMPLFPGDDSSANEGVQLLTFLLTTARSNEVYCTASFEAMFSLEAIFSRKLGNWFEN